jgi:hypothetical protein
MEFFDILSDNQDFVFGAYDLSAFVGWFFLLLMVDVVLKGIAMWRAARMGKMSWFLALLVVNSMAILPLIFLLITNSAYQEWQKTVTEKTK